MHIDPPGCLLNQGRVVREIEEASGLTHGLVVSERAAREIKPHLAGVTEEISGRVAAGEEPTEVVTEVVTKTRRKARVANQAPDICEDDLERQRRASVLFRALEHLGQFAVSPEEAIADIPDEQAFRVDEYLDAAKWWLERFAAAWTEQQRRVGSS